MQPGIGRARLIGWACAAVAMMALMVCCPTCDKMVKAEPMYYAGDSLGLVITGRDSLGAAVSPDTTRLFVYRLGVVVDSSDTYPGTIAALAGSPVSLIATYVIPSSWSGPYDLTFTAYGTADGITDEMQITPSRVRVNAIQDSVRSVALVASTTLADSVRSVRKTWETRAGYLDSVGVGLNVDLVDLVTATTLADSVRATGRAWDVRGGSVDSVGLALLLDEELSVAVDSVSWVGYVDTVRFAFRTDTTTTVDETITASATVDSFPPSAIEDFYQGIAGNATAYLDTTSCASCGIYYNGTPTEGQVWLTTESTLRIGNGTSNVSAMAYATSGYWSARVPLQHARPDTVYLWAWDGIRYLRSGTQIVFN